MVAKGGVISDLGLPVCCKAISGIVEGVLTEATVVSLEPSILVFSKNCKEEMILVGDPGGAVALTHPSTTEREGEEMRK